MDIPQTLTISAAGAGGHLELGNLDAGGIISGTSSQMTLDFANGSLTGPNTGVIQIDGARLAADPIATQTITDVAWGDAFVINGLDFTGDTATLTGNVLTVTDATDAAVFTMDDVSAVAGTSFVVSGDVIQAVCYARGTLIQTPGGELPVEKLRRGKQVTTLVDGEAVSRTIRWLGHRRIDLTAHPRPETVAPIRVHRDAFADNAPRRDLLVSPDHAIFVDGMLICARQLVNGTTIRQERGWTVVDYFHVELDQHAIMMAEGLPAESYLDTGNRGFFANGDAPLMLHPDLTTTRDHPTRAAGSCAPFVFDDAVIRPVWRRLAERAETLGHVWTAPATTEDPGLRLLVDGQSIAPVTSGGGRYVFALPAALSEPGSVRLISRSGAPSDLVPYPADRRRLGVAVQRIVVRSSAGQSEIPADHPGLSRGWHEAERDGGALWRWTNGDAVVPLSGLTGPAVLEIRLAGSMRYVVDVAPMERTGQLAA